MMQNHSLTGESPRWIYCFAAWSTNLSKSWPLKSSKSATSLPGLGYAKRGVCSISAALSVKTSSRISISPSPEPPSVIVAISQVASQWTAIFNNLDVLTPRNLDVPCSSQTHPSIENRSYSVYLLSASHCRTAGHFWFGFCRSRPGSKRITRAVQCTLFRAECWGAG